MNSINRRHFLKILGASSVVAAHPAILRAQTRSRVVVVGGGFAGATVAKYLRLWSDNTIDVTLIDRNPSHVSCIMSNLVLNDQLTLDDLTFNYEDLQVRYGVEPIADSVEGVDAGEGRLRLASGGWLSYDRLVVAPGISFAEVPGLDAEQVPHAWIAGSQTLTLRNQLATMPTNGTFVMTVPPSPYRCPPGPYERACLVADWLLRNKRGQSGRPQVVVLDANPSIQAEAETFTRAFEGIYRDVIEYHANAELFAVDSSRRTAFSSVGDFPADVLNVIPPHRAGQVILDSGLAADGRWVDVDPLTYQIKNFNDIDLANIHVIGDSQGTGQPKSGHMANAQAKVCVDAVIRLLAGVPVDLPNRTDNILTNSACYSPITDNEASWLTAVYAYDPVTGQMQVVPESFGEAGEWTRNNFEDMFSWSQNLFADTFG